MRAVSISIHGGVEVLQSGEHPIPEPLADQVRIKVAWSALNHLDLWVRQGVPGHTFPLPLIPGCDFSGVVDAVGEQVSSWLLGDRVTVAPGFACYACEKCKAGKHNLCRDYGIYGETCNGGNAEYAVVDAKNLLAVPDGFPLDVAAAFPLAYLTAWHMLVSRCSLQEGDKVLVHAAGSGVSVAAVQIAKHWGADVMVTAGSDAKVNKGLENGADFGVNYQTKDWEKEARSWTKKRGLDIIVDHVGADTLPKGLRQLAKGGRIVTCGVTSGAEMELNMAPLFFKSLSVLGSTMGSLQDMHTVADLVFSGQLTPIIDSRYDFADIALAHQRMGERQAFGKLLLQVNPAVE